MMFNYGFFFVAVNSERWNVIGWFVARPQTNVYIVCVLTSKLNDVWAAVTQTHRSYARKVGVADR